MKPSSFTGLPDKQTDWCSDKTPLEKYSVWGWFLIGSRPRHGLASGLVSKSSGDLCLSALT
jgi:hypothetical protein